MPMTGIIYRATNTFNGMVYIGQTMAGLPKRKSQHYRDAKADADNAFHLALYQYHNAFEWEVVDSFSGTKEQVIHALNVAEEYHILKHKSTDAGRGYNSTFGGYSSDKFADRILERAKANQGAAKAVLQYDLDGNFVKEFPSLSAVSAFLNRDKFSPCDLCTGAHYHSQWRMKENEYFPRKIGAYKRLSSANRVSILAYDPEGNFLREFGSAEDAYAEYGRRVKPRDLTERLELYECFTRPYYLFRKPGGEYPKKIQIVVKRWNVREKKGTPAGVRVHQYDLDGNYMKSFDSLRAAGRESGVGENAIRESGAKEQPIRIRTYTTKFVWRIGNIDPPAHIDVIKFQHKPHNDYYKHKMEHRIIQYSLDGEFVRVWDNTNKAAMSKADTTALIRKSLVGEPSKKASFQWRYYSEDYPERIAPASWAEQKTEKTESIIRPDDTIEELDWTGEVIAVYRNTADAARNTGCSQSYVCNVLAGKIRHPRHRFRRANEKV